MVITSKFQELEQFANDHGLYIAVNKDKKQYVYRFFTNPFPDFYDDASLYTAEGISEAETFIRGWVSALYCMKESYG